MGVAATLEQDWDEAEDSLRRAIVMAENAQAATELGRSQLDLAQMLAVRGAEGDRDEAIEFVLQAKSRLEACGPRAFGERAEKLATFLVGRRN